MRWLFLLFLFVVTLYGLSDSAILKRADKLVKNEDKTSQFRAYNDYKSLYLKAIIAGDEKLKTKSLQGIVKSGDKLHIDISSYSKELSSVKQKSSYSQPKQQKIKAQNSSQVKVNKSSKLESLAWNNDELILKFDQALSQSQINYFTLYDSKKKQYKYVFDIHASMLTKSNTLKKEGIQRIKIGQYKPNTLRLVIENNSKLKVSHKKSNNILTISVELVEKISNPHANIPHKNISGQISIDRDKIIVIDPGHGGKDPGAIGYKKIQEKNIVFTIAKELKKILNERGYKVYMTRYSDKFIKLSHRTAYANQKKANLFISIHANSIGRDKAEKVSGIESFFLSTSRSSRAERVAAKENSADLSEMNVYGKQSFLSLLNSHKILASNKLAIDLQRGMLESLNKRYKDVQDAGVREGPFWVLVGAQMPSVLIEVGFISNSKEAKRLMSSKYQNTMALGMANGIERYFMHN